MSNSPLPKYTFGWSPALIMFAGMMIASLVAAIPAIVALLGFKTNLRTSDFYMILLNASGLIGAILAFDYLVCRPQTGKPLNFNMSTANVTTYFLIFPMMFGMMLIAEVLTSHIPITGPIFGKLYDSFNEMMKMMTKDTPTLLVVAVGFAPVLEEIIFRGIIMKGLINKGWNPWKAIALSSIIFGLIHGNPWQFIGAGCLGFVLGVVYYRTKSLLLSMLLHAFNNLLACLFSIFYKTENFSEQFGWPEWAVLLAGVTIFGTFYYLFTKKYRVHFSDK